MSAKVYQFQSKKASKKEKVQARTNSSIFVDVQDDVLGAWQEAAIRDDINGFLHDIIPNRAKLNGADYINDLNAITSVEKSLSMKVVIFSPGCTPSNPVGWLVGFHRGEDIFTTPPDMATEGYGRAMNVALYVWFEKILKSLGRK